MATFFLVGSSFFLAQYFQSSLLTYVLVAAVWLFLVYEAIIKLSKKLIGTEFFVVIATFFALVNHEEQALMIIYLIILFVHYIELLIEDQTTSSLESLLKLAPSTALLVENGKEYEVPLTSLTIGMTVLVKTGMAVPVDGKVVSGLALVNQAALTGESMLQEKSAGLPVYATSYLESGSLYVHVEKIEEDTVFGKMTQLLMRAHQDKASIETITTRIALFFTPLILIIIAVVWFLTYDSSLVMTLLVFGSPLELSLVTPITLLSGTIAAFKQGVLIKSARALEQLASLDTLIFDKTGTLTSGKPAIIAIIPYQNTCTEKELLRLCAIGQRYSDHAFAESIIKQAEQESLVVSYPEWYESLAGHGVAFLFEGVLYHSGNRHYLESSEHCSVVFPQEWSALATYEQSASILFLAAGKQVLGFLALADTVRPEAAEIVAQLKGLGVREFVMLSGDKSSVVERVAQSVGITKAYGNVFPDQKFAFLQKMQTKGHKVAMVGDGINDALALKQADVGIALGGLGIEPAIDAAAIVLMTNNVKNIPFIFALSKKIKTTIYQNLLIGFLGVHSIGFIISAVTGWITPVTAALLHGTTDILILFNSARLIWFKQSSKSL